MQVDFHLSDNMAEDKVQNAIVGSTLLTALMYILVGLIMLVCGSGSINLIFWLSGIIFILFGIIEIILKTVDVKGGLILIVTGIILLVIGCFSAIAEVLVGIILILSALPALLGMSSLFAVGVSMPDSGNALLNKIITVVLLIVGICLIVGLFADVADDIADILIRVGGLVLLVLGIVDLVKVVK